MMNTDCPEECRHWICNYSGAVCWPQEAAFQKPKKQTKEKAMPSDVSFAILLCQ